MKAIATVCFLLLALGTVGASATLKVNSVTFSAPVPLKAGDIITVDLTGTPGTNAAFAVKGFMPVVKMQELSAGSYHGMVKVPNGRFIRNAPLIGYLGSGDNHAPPVQASRLISVINKSEEVAKPSVPALGMTRPVVVPNKLPRVEVEAPLDKPSHSAPTPVLEPVVTSKPASVAPPPAPVAIVPKAVAEKIVLTNPIGGGIIRRMIVVKGNADPGSTVKVSVTYSNGLAGILKLAGEVSSQDLAVGKNGKFVMSPIALSGPLATNGLRFTIKAYYPDRADHATAEVSVTGQRD